MASNDDPWAVTETIRMCPRSEGTSTVYHAAGASVMSSDPGPVGVEGLFSNADGEVATRLSGLPMDLPGSEGVTG